MATGAIRCPHCQARLSAGDERCPGCDTPLRASAAPERRPERPARRHYVVTAAGEPFPLYVGRPFVIGRSRDANLVAWSTDVSRRHAQLFLAREDAPPLLQELEARHGTFVNNERLPTEGERRLVHGDRVRLASNTVFFYLYVPEPELDREIAAWGLGGLTSEWAMRDIRKRKTTRRMRRQGRREEGAPRLMKLPAKGDFMAMPGSQLLALLKEHAFNGEVTFYDGAQRGFVWVLGGLPRDGAVGRLKGPDAIAQLTGMRAGTFRLRRGFPDLGSLSEIPADDLLVELYEARATGVLNLLRDDDPEALIGRLVVIDGISRTAGLGRLAGTEALAQIGELRTGRFVFERKPRDELDGRLQTPRGRRETIRQPGPPPGAEESGGV